MASRSLGALTLDLIAKTGGFTSGMDKAARHADRRGREMQRDAERRAAAFRKAWTLAGTAIAGVMAALEVRKVIQLGDQIDKLALRTGLATDQVQGLQRAFSLNGASADDLNNVFRTLNRNMVDTMNGTGSAKDAFAALGVSVTDVSGKLRSNYDVMLDAADALAKIENQAEASALAQKVFGEAGQNLLPMLQQGRAGIEGMVKESADLGHISEKNTKRFAAFGDATGDLWQAVQGLASTLIGPLVEAMTKIANLVTRLISGFNNLAKAAANAFSSVKDDIADQVQHDARALEQGYKNLAAARERGAKGLIAQRERELAALEERYKRSAAALTAIPNGPGAGPQTAVSPTPPTLPVGSGKGTDADKAMQSYQAAMEGIRQAQLAARISTEELTASELNLYRLMNSPEWSSWPQIWREALIEQTAVAVEIEKTASAQARLNQLLEATPTAQLEKQRADMQLLADAYMLGKINAEQYFEAVNTALGGGTPEATAKAKDGFLDLTTVANDAARNMAQGLTNFFFDPFNGSVKDMLRNFLTAIGKMIAQALMLKAIQAGMSALGIPGFENGGAFNQSGQITAFADGGVVDKPTLFNYGQGQTGVMGEAGAEAIMPLKRGPDGKLGVLAQGGGAGDIEQNVSIIITVNQAQGNESQQSAGDTDKVWKQAAARMKQIALETITDQARPGGMLYR